MRTLYFLVPGTGGKFACGGLWAELKTLKLAQSICRAEVVTYQQREPGTLFLDELLKQSQLEDVIFVISWGFHVAKLADRLKSYHVIYHAHSSGYGFRLPATIPIITVSRNTMGYWGQRSPNALIYYLPNQIADEFSNLNQVRDIDVLVQTRKSSEYLMKQLLPALQQQCRVYVVDAYVEDLPKLFNRAKVYLYDSAEYWAQQGVSEGFGLQPLEALACGCQVFSSVNDGLSDYLDPGFNCHKIAGFATEYDVQQILSALPATKSLTVSASLLAEHRLPNITHRLTVILQQINLFFDAKEKLLSPIPDLTRKRIMQLNWQRRWRKFRHLVQKKFGRQ
jgi:glycosyltransferase involved in cell wall biosynthesis